MKKPNKIELKLLDEEASALRRELDEFKVDPLNDSDTIRVANLDERLRNIEAKLINYKNTIYEENT